LWRGLGPGLIRPFPHRNPTDTDFLFGVSVVAGLAPRAYCVDLQYTVVLLAVVALFLLLLHPWYLRKNS
jgi:hypothetical protein